MGSVFKAGGAAAAAAAVVLLLGFILILGDFIGFCFICGGFLIPIAAGLSYGYFASGEEEMSQSAVGGALSGGASGMLLGIFFGIFVAVNGALTGALGDALAGGSFATIFCVCGLGIAGLLFGAMGGAIWPVN